VLDLLPPFPIVLVSTQNNVLTVNQVAYFSFRPLRIGVAIARVRHSYALIEAEREFVVNVPHASLVGTVQLCGRVSGRDGDKFSLAELGRERSTEVSAVSVAQCGAQIECRVERTVEFELRTWFIGRVVAARAHAEHRGMEALTCGRRAYVLPGEVVAAR
jgi:flavin reductase (DIM6/NTAB) family NADH-FMN oxidoreductase RutF